MAITAMHKTAKLKQDAKPKAEAIINNGYVDDICDSAGNINDAKTLISLMLMRYLRQVDLRLRSGY